MALAGGAHSFVRGSATGYPAYPCPAVLRRGWRVSSTPYGECVTLGYVKRGTGGDQWAPAWDTPAEHEQTGPRRATAAARRRRCRRRQDVRRPGIDGHAPRFGKATPSRLRSWIASRAPCRTPSTSLGSCPTAMSGLRSAPLSTPGTTSSRGCSCSRARRLVRSASSSGNSSPLRSGGAGHAPVEGHVTIVKEVAADAPAAHERAQAQGEDRGYYEQWIGAEPVASGPYAAEDKGGAPR